MYSRASAVPPHVCAPPDSLSTSRSTFGLPVTALPLISILDLLASTPSCQPFPSLTDTHQCLNLIRNRFAGIANVSSCTSTCRPRHSTSLTRHKYWACDGSSRHDTLSALSGSATRRMPPRRLRLLMAYARASGDQTAACSLDGINAREQAAPPRQVAHSRNFATYYVMK